MSLYVNRIRYKGMTPTLGASSGVINKAVINGVDFWDDNYDPTPPAHDYSQDYFTIECLTGGSISFNRRNSSGGTKNISYSKNNGTSWVNNNSTTGFSISCNAGDVILLKGTNDCLGSAVQKYQFYFNFTCDVKLSGNIYSLLLNDNFYISDPTQKTFRDNLFTYLFWQQTHILDAENLIFQDATFNTMGGQFGYMFTSCSNMVKGPKILVKNGVSELCYMMFYGCSSLIEATCLIENLGTGNSTGYMFQNINTNGTLYKNANVTWTTDWLGIPSTWTQVNYVA